MIWSESLGMERSARWDAEDGKIDGVEREMIVLTGL